MLVTEWTDDNGEAAISIPRAIAASAEIQLAASPARVQKKRGRPVSTEM